MPRLQSLIAFVFLISPQLFYAQIKYETLPGATERRSLLLRDYKPQSSLRLAVHNVQRSKYPVIDVHSHLNDAMGIHPERIPAAKAVEMMDRCNIRQIWILTGMWGSKLENLVEEMVKPYPGRFVVFTQIDWSKIDAPNFSELMAKQIDDSVAHGARGLKVLKDLGLQDRDKSGKLVAVDDPRLDPIWEECGRLGIPVSIHSADPEAFFHPADATNEQYEELAGNPTWQFWDRTKYPSHLELLQARDRVFVRHPNTQFIALHVASWPENLDYVSGLLDRCPNVMVEFGARQAELGRQPRRARQFFIEYQNRILFGTDYPVSEAMYRSHFRWLETADEYFEHWDSPSLGRWMISALDLPDPVLEKVYSLNAERILRQFKGVK